MREWRPIETAPKDGTEVLVFRNSPKPFAVHRVFVASFSERKAAWRIATTDMKVANVTHWMPLPEPPAA